MKNDSTIRKAGNSKGAAIFKKMLDDKRAIHEHIRNGGKISDLKDKFNFVNVRIHLREYDNYSF
jgi:hypothetical protein